MKRFIQQISLIFFTTLLLTACGGETTTVPPQFKSQLSISSIYPYSRPNAYNTLLLSVLQISQDHILWAKNDIHSIEAHHEDIIKN